MGATRSAKRSRRRARLGTAAVSTVVASVSTMVTGVQAAQAATATPNFGPGIDAYQPFDGPDQCEPSEKPGVVDFRRLVLAAYPGTSDAGIGRPCSDPRISEHKEGRAWDWWVSVHTQRHLANDLLNWLLATDQYGNRHALVRRFGIMYIIWDARIWKSYQADRGWQPYACDGSETDCHRNHVHFSFGWAGALRHTSWWNAQQPAPPPIGTDTVGFYRNSDASWHLTNDNQGGSDAAFVWGPTGPNATQ